MINFNCQLCKHNYSYTNKCLLKMHVLSHMSNGEEVSVDVAHLDIVREAIHNLHKDKKDVLKNIVLNSFLNCIL